jgi:acetyl/propionyl-CoA carboxylase alpha subunit
VLVPSNLLTRKVAEGHPLPLAQNELAIHGHAFEARVYAENPKNDFLPGKLSSVNLICRRVFVCFFFLGM